MDKEHLMTNGKLFAYETSKYFKEPERLLRQFTCDNEIVVLSSIKIYVYFFEKFIDVREEKLGGIGLRETEFGYNIEVKDKIFNLNFKTLEEKNIFAKYINEFK